MTTESSIAPADAAPRPWRPAPLLAISMLLHAACVGALLAAPEMWLWVVATLIGNHLVLGVGVLLPRTRLLGPNIERLPRAAALRGEVSCTFDDGPDPHITPRILDLLDQHGARASFFCVGEKAAAHPEIVREIGRRGHSVENHSYAHSHVFAFYGPVRLSREIERAQQALVQLTGRRPAYFRAPAGFRSPFLDFVLGRHGLRYVSWTRRGYDAVTADPDRVLRRLTRGLAAGDVLLLHDSSRVIEQMLPALLDELARRGLRSVSLPSAIP
jgi:peptidoglycan/xylan/chitin deacetylase (PgdA/CDA1 family)